MKKILVSLCVMLLGCEPTQEEVDSAVACSRYQTAQQRMDSTAIFAVGKENRVWLAYKAKQFYQENAPRNCAYPPSVNQLTQITSEGSPQIVQGSDGPQVPAPALRLRLRLRALLLGWPLSIIGGAVVGAIAGGK